MESPRLPPLQPPIEANVASTTNAISADSNLNVDEHTQPNSAMNARVIKKKMKKKNKKKDVQRFNSDVSLDPPQQSLNSFSSSSSTSNSLHPRSKGIRLYSSRKNPRVLSGPVSQRHNDSEADALALPLGMSIAAFVAQVLEKKEATRENMSIHHLSKICSLAVKESLSNVFGNKFDCFVSNFERSFQSTLMTLRVINETTETNKRSYQHVETSSTSTCDYHFDMKETTSTRQEQASIVSEFEEHMHRDPLSNQLAILHDSRTSQQLTHMPQNQLHMLERSVSEQVRSNNLKEVELSLKVKSMKLKEAQIAVNCDSNILDRFKLSMGISKANFRAEKFKTELEDSRHGQLLKKCADFLVAGLMIMLFSLAYGTYIHSYERLVEATESCIPTKASSSWWMPKQMATFSSGFQILRCQAQVITRMVFGGFMIIAIVYLLLQRSGTTNQTMPITFILLLLGVGCGFSGKFCIDTLGGSGTHWLFYWELLCFVHFFSNVWPSMLFYILHGPVTVADVSIGSKLFPYWLRRFVFYAMVLVYLPLSCGLIPFAGPGEWFEHFGSLVMGRGPE